jgi:hypothetical protein
MVIVALLEEIRVVEGVYAKSQPNLNGKKYINK